MVFAALFLAPPLAATDVYIQIQRGQKAAIGFPDFVAKGGFPAEKEAVGELRDVVKNDILFTRLFNLLEEGPAPGEGRIDFAGWEKAGADLLITAHVNLKEGGRDEEGALQMIASVYEIPGGNPIFQKSYRAARRSARRIAHAFVADFLYRFTGDRGVSESRIAFVNDATGSKELCVIDADGASLRRLTSDKSIALLPRWSPDGREIAFTSFRQGNPDLYLYSFSQGTSRAVSLRKGLNSAACFSPDGKTIAVTLSGGGPPNLYLLDRQGNLIRRLTRVKAAETSPSFSPDGRKIVFTSDRPGWPQIYMMDVDGTNLTRLSESGYCDSPVWSPRGDKIAYSRGTEKGVHDIVVQDVAGGQAVQITRDVGRNENPSFSPDGRFLVFSSTREGRRELYIASVEGAVLKKIGPIPGNSYTPSWGP